jgi:hypothetical protein
MISVIVVALRRTKALWRAEMRESSRTELQLAQSSSNAKLALFLTTTCAVTTTVSLLFPSLRWTDLSMHLPDLSDTYPTGL